MPASVLRPAYPQTAMPPPLARPIGSVASVQEDETGGVVFLYGWPTFTWEAGDVVGRRLAAVQLVLLKGAQQQDVAAAFDVVPATLWRWLQNYKAHGISGLVPERRGPRGPHKLTPELEAEIERLRNQRLSLRQIGTHTHLSPGTIRRALGAPARRRGVPAAVQPAREPATPADPPASPATGDEQVTPAPALTDPAPALSPPSDEQAPALPAVPQPEPRVEERQAARWGAIEEAAPVITEGRHLPLAGLLLILPALSQVGLLEVTRTLYGRLHNGFYGLRSMLLTLAFLALLREPRAEGATRVSPTDLGRILGLDRAPEVKTIRRRLGELAERHLGEKLVFELARRHAGVAPEALGFLYVDGHVRVYSGTRRLPKAHVARARISAPATLETWACDANGDPIFVVVAPPGASMVSEVRRLLPELKSLVGDRRLTICFDRGGWSPELFYEILQADFDFLTYRKGNVRREPARAFHTHRFIEKGRTYEYKLADRRVRLRLPVRKGWPKTLLVRQVTRQVGSHQTPIVGSRFDLAPAEFAHRMFSRWREENYFRYSRRHFALDGLDSYASSPDDLARSVPNPQRAQLNRQLAQVKRRLDRLEAALGAQAIDDREVRRTMRSFKVANATLTTLVEMAREQVGQLEDALKQTPTRVPLGQVAPDSRLLETDVKLVTHAVRMSVYNAESVLARLLFEHYSRAEDEARALLREAFEAAGDLRVRDGVLDVRLNPLSAPRRTGALFALCDHLTATETLYPGTDLRLVFSVKTPAQLA